MNAIYNLVVVRQKFNFINDSIITASMKEKMFIPKHKNKYHP